MAGHRRSTTPHPSPAAATACGPDGPGRRRALHRHYPSSAAHARPSKTHVAREGSTPSGATHPYPVTAIRKADAESIGNRWGSTDRPMSNDDTGMQNSPGMCPHCESRIDQQTLGDHLHYCEVGRAAAQAELTDSFGGDRR